MKTLRKAPRVSIGLPVYNGEKYVGEAIESVLAQTFKDFELVISDNASTDRTEEICREYAAKDSRIRYYRNEKNLGAAKNFNKVFKLSSGEYFKWFASDCTIEPEFLMRCVEFLDKELTVVLAYTYFKARSEFKYTIECLDMDCDVRSSVTHQRFHKLVKQRFATKLPIWGLVRSSILKDTHLIRPFIGSDDCLLIELILKGDFAQVPEYLMTVRRHPESYTDIKNQNDGVEGAAETQWLDTTNKGRIFLPHWRRLWEYLLLVIRSNDSSSGKIMMIASLFCLIGTKWPIILVKELFFAIGLQHLYGYLKRIKRYLCKQGTKRADCTAET